MKITFNHIAFELTSLCNLNCKYCYNIWKIPDYKDFKHFNSYKQAKKTLKKLFRIADVKHITFTGGEPFIAERFPELVLYTRLRKKSVTIITNGNAAYEEDYIQMSELGINLFELPILSYDKDIHDQLTQTKGSWKKCIKSVKILKELNMKVIAVIVITKLNYDHIPETMELIYKLGINHVMLNRFNIGGQGISEKEQLQLSKEELNFAYSNASKAAKKFHISLTSNVCTPMCIINPENYKNIKFSFCSPDITKRPLTIDIYGDIRFCNHSPAKLGNIFRDDIRKILDSSNAKLWSDTIPIHCTDCKLYEKCMAGCRAASEQMGLSIKHADPILLNM